MSDQLAALRLFVRVARTGSFSRAAREQNIAQPTVSRMISALEEEVGALLLTRTTRALTLTDAGSAYLARIEPLLDSLDEANQEVRGTGELRGVLRVGLSSTLAVRAVIPILPGFSGKHPKLRIELLIDDRRQDLVFEGVDIALRFGTIADSTAVARRIVSWPRAIAASPGYVERFGAPKTPADLADHSAIVGSAGIGSGWSFSRDGEKVAVRVGGNIMTSQNEGAIAAAIAGLGIVATTREALKHDFASGALLALLPDWELDPVDVHAVFASGRAAKPAAKLFADFLSDAFHAAYDGK